MRVTLFVLLLSTAAGPSFADDAAEPLTLAQQLASAEKQVVGNWYADLDATRQYVKRRFGGDGSAAAYNDHLKKHSNVVLQMSKGNEFRILSRTDLSRELYKGRFVMTIDSAGVVYFMGVDDDGDLVEPRPILFDNDRLVWLRHGSPSADECTVFKLGGHTVVGPLSKQPAVRLPRMRAATTPVHKGLIRCEVPGESGVTVATYEIVPGASITNYQSIKPKRGSYEFEFRFLKHENGLDFYRFCVMNRDDGFGGQGMGAGADTEFSGEKVTVLDNENYSVEIVPKD